MAKADRITLFPHRGNREGMLDVARIAHKILGSPEGCRAYKRTSRGGPSFDFVLNEEGPVPFEKLFVYCKRNAKNIRLCWKRKAPLGTNEAYNYIQWLCLVISDKMGPHIQVSLGTFVKGEMSVQGGFVVGKAYPSSYKGEGKSTI